MKRLIALLPGDGVGPEVTDEARRVLEAAARGQVSLAFDEQLLGGVAIDATGEPLPAASLQAALGAHAVLMGAVGSPRHSDPAAPVRPEQGLLALRKAMGVYANLRPVKAYPSLHARSPLKDALLDGVDILFVRELTGGLYFGKPQYAEVTAEGRRAVDTLVYTELEVRRVVRMAFELALGRRRKLTSLDKANVLESSRLWRTVTNEVASGYPDVALDHQLVDSGAMLLIKDPRRYDVIVTENMFGDILTDEASVLGGSLGLLPSASLGDGPRGLYEPVHGSAPDIAGKGIANPMGAILSVAMLLRHSLGLAEAAARVESAVESAIAAGETTPDLGGSLGTRGVGDAVLARLAE